MQIELQFFTSVSSGNERKHSIAENLFSHQYIIIINYSLHQNKYQY